MRGNEKRRWRKRADWFEEVTASERRMWEGERKNSKRRNRGKEGEENLDWGEG